MVLVNADINGLSGDANKISYHLPAMGGLSAGVSFMNSGASGAKDSTEVGAQYTMEAGGAGITIGYASGTTEQVEKLSFLFDFPFSTFCYL
jgi:predicted porin